jgi:hypothetical protein
MNRVTIFFCGLGLAYADMIMLASRALRLEAIIWGTLALLSLGLVFGCLFYGVERGEE